MSLYIPVKVRQVSIKWKFCQTSMYASFLINGKWTSPTFNGYTVTWNPNDPCFAWKRPSFGRFKPQNRGQTGSRQLYMLYGYTSYMIIIQTRLLGSHKVSTLLRAPGKPCVSLRRGVRFGWTSSSWFRSINFGCRGSRWFSRRRASRRLRWCYGTYPTTIPGLGVFFLCVWSSVWLVSYL